MNLLFCYLNLPLMKYLKGNKIFTKFYASCADDINYHGSATSLTLALQLLSHYTLNGSESSYNSEAELIVRFSVFPLY